MLEIRDIEFDKTTGRILAMRGKFLPRGRMANGVAVRN